MKFRWICVLVVCAWPSVSFSQTQRSRTDGVGHRHSTSLGLSHGRDHNHQYYGPQPAPGFGCGSYSSPGYGYGYSPYGYSSYSSITWGVPGFSVGYSAPLFGTPYYGNGYYGNGYEYSPPYGYGWSAPIYVAPPLTVNPLNQGVRPLPQWMIDEANLDNNRLEKIKPISQTHRSLIQPSTPEAQLRSVRLQDAGDRLFANLDYSAAEKSYAKSVQAAPDRPEPYARLAVTKAARGDFRGAVNFLKQMAEVDVTYPNRADSLATLFGPQNGVSKLQLKQRVADWTKVDVRDSDRVFLLGIVLFLDGDERFRTLLDTCLKLEGEQPYLRAFLDSTPAVDNAKLAPTPEEIDALSPPMPVLANPLLLPPRLPEPPAP